MDIEGPIRVGVVDKDDGTGRELHLDFSDNFRQLSDGQRISEFRSYINLLRNKSSGNSLDEADRQGMLLILQIAEQLLPHLETDQLPLEETIMIEIKPETILGSLIN
ncbi:MAG: hypothetical protein BMS9Abin33_0155 [Gammaproteobacteria bacterium]|nr:MAG: hypothetical protein BMS9Abin33_0155 [Gammaproteobacteria bacterium]